jgi:hypothetical protein
LSGDPLTCHSGWCELTCKTSGSCASSAECCASPKHSYGYMCDLSTNSCSICGNLGVQCYSDKWCCGGLRCASKPATPNYFECMP